MSNSTPAAIRAKDKQRKQQEKQLKRVGAERKPRLRPATRIGLFLIFTAIPGSLTIYQQLRSPDTTPPTSTGVTWSNSHIEGGKKAALLVLGNPRMNFDNTTVKGTGEYGVIADPDGKTVASGQNAPLNR
jgi:hypothetical protein